MIKKSFISNEIIYKNKLTKKLLIIEIDINELKTSDKKASNLLKKNIKIIDNDCNLSVDIFNILIKMAQNSGNFYFVKFLYI